MRSTPWRTPLLVLAGSALLASCAGSSPAGSGAGGAPPPAGSGGARTDRLPTVDQLVQRGLLLPGETRREIERTLGEPDSVHSRVVPNRHVPGVQDTIFELFYPEIRFEIHRPGGGRDLLSSVEVASDRYLRYPRLGIGTPREEVLRVLGEPDRTEAGALTYLCRGCMGAEEPATFLFENGRVSRIRFDYYVD